MVLKALEKSKTWFIECHQYHPGDSQHSAAGTATSTPTRLTRFHLWSMVDQNQSLYCLHNMLLNKMCFIASVSYPVTGSG